MNTQPEHISTDETRDALAAALANRDKLKEAVTRAITRAADAEVARSAAEENHAAVVADALFDDKPTPGKPAALSAVQAADDSADAALELLNRRLLAAEGVAHTAAVVHVEAKLAVIIADQVKAGDEALVRLVQAAVDLHAPRGTSVLRSALELCSQYNWPEGQTLVAVRALAAEVPLIPRVAAIYESRLAESVKPLEHKNIVAILKTITQEI